MKKSVMLGIYNHELIVSYTCTSTKSESSKTYTLGDTYGIITYGILRTDGYVTHPYCQ